MQYEKTEKEKGKYEHSITEWWVWKKTLAAFK